MSEEELTELRQKLKPIFRGYTHMNHSTEKKLKELGFIIIRCKRHYILSYTLCGKDLRIEVSRTPSDFRMGLKKVSDIIYVIRSSGLVY